MPRASVIRQRLRVAGVDQTPSLANLSGQERKKEGRRLERFAKKSAVGLVTLADVHPNSPLPEWAEAAIGNRSLEMLTRLPTPPATRPRQSYAQKLKARAKANRSVPNDQKSE